MHRLSKLKNGLSLITAPTGGTKAVTVMVLLPVGSRYETAKISGASHFVEHLMFKGTKKRPTAQHISRELDAVGADYNAFTYKDYTGYYIKIDGRRVELAFDILADMLFDSTFDEKEITKERGVIAEEIKMYEDNPSMAVELVFDRTVFGGNPLGRDVAGTAETVKNITRDELFAYYKNAYTPANMALAVSGNAPREKIKKLAAKYFANTPSSPPHQSIWCGGEPPPYQGGGTADSFPPLIKGSGKEGYFNKENFIKFSWPAGELPLEKRVSVEQRKIDQSHVVMGFAGFAYNDPIRYANAVLLTVLGSGMSSRLFVEVREKRGLAYMIHAGGVSHNETGVITINAGLDSNRLGEALSVIKSELKKIADKGISKKELDDAKTNISGRMALSMENSSAVAEWFARQHWFADKIETPEQQLEKIERVTAGQVRGAARRFFDWKRMRLAVIGPKSKEEILKLLV
ncbi:insulinase family protein [Patescibacteria group bacterium]|nr:MAG: insulinase family protein [Patescibacteria group bacterium]